MAFWDKVKDFIGIEDDYYDEDFDDFEDEYEADNIDYNLDQEDEYEEVEEIYKEDKPLRSKQGFRESNEISQNKTNRSYGSNNNMVVSIKEPLTYEDGKAVLDDILDKKTVVLNLEMLEMDKKTQIFYFVSGGLYSLRGSIQNVTKDIYVLVPEGVEVDNKIKETISNESLYQI